MPGDERLPVIVLAAGRGRRMGGPKALMKVAGVPWWFRQSQQIFDAGAAAVWVVSPEVRAAMEKDAAFLKQPVVAADPDAPMFESVRAGLRMVEPMEPRGVYILPIDVPAPRREVWEVLAGGGPVSVPTFGAAHGHPVYLEWTFVRSHVPLHGSADGRLDTIIGPHARYVPVNDPDVAFNLNTPEAVRAYEDELGRRPGSARES